MKYIYTRDNDDKKQQQRNRIIIIIPDTYCTFVRTEITMTVCTYRSRGTSDNVYTVYFSE